MYVYILSYAGYNKAIVAQIPTEAQKIVVRAKLLRHFPAEGMITAGRAVLQQ